MKTFIIIDMQNDFCPGGALAVQEGDKIIPLINLLQNKFDLVVATQDWHPKTHKSFASNHPGKAVFDVITLDGLTQVLWPDHCVQGTKGALLVDELEKNRIEKIIQKGTDMNIDSYSGFFDNGHKKATGLDEYLKLRKADEIYLAGLATDFCVKFTALDAVKLGYKTHVIIDACRGVNINAGDADKAIREMADNGIKIVNSKNIIK